MRQLQLVVVTAAMGILAISCATAGATPPTVAAPQGSVVNATLSDQMKLTLDQTSVPAGPVTFNVTNSGKLAHEVVLLQTDLAQDKIPADTNPADPAGMVDESASVGETGDMAAGTTKSFTVTLGPGNYVAICNEPGHYMSGMHLAFTVVDAVGLHH